MPTTQTVAARRTRAERPPRSECPAAPELAALAWIGEQSAVRADVIGRLLGPGATVSDRAARRRVDRWQRAGLVETRRFLAGEPPVVWLTRAGLRLVGAPYRPVAPPVGLLAHLHAVCLVRLGVETAGGRGWVSERALLRARPTPDAHLADGCFQSPAGTDTAVEVELTRKGADRLRGIVDELTIDHDAVLYVVQGDAVRAGVERAVDTLDEHDRVTIVDLAAFAGPGPPGEPTGEARRRPGAVGATRRRGGAGRAGGGGRPDAGRRGDAGGRPRPAGLAALAGRGRRVRRVGGPRRGGRCPRLPRGRGCRRRTGGAPRVVRSAPRTRRGGVRRRGRRRAARPRCGALVHHRDEHEETRHARRASARRRAATRAARRVRRARWPTPTDRAVLGVPIEASGAADGLGRPARRVVTVPMR